MSYQDRPVTNPHRRSIRLQGHDYAQAGAYFVTICTHQRAPLFGQVVDREMVLSAIGEIAQAEWLQTAVVRPSIELDAFVIMPNHMHGIVFIHHDSPVVGATRRVAPTISSTPTSPSAPTLQSGSLGAIIGQFKSVETKRIRRNPNIDPDHPLWQRNYHDHIIRNEADLNRIREYMLHNPARWQQDILFA
jgi:REP element-mobilizing transposase RayT